MTKDLKDLRKLASRLGLRAIESNWSQYADEP